LLSDPTRAAFLGEQARKSAERENWENETRELVWAYRRAIKKHARSGVVGKLRAAFP